VEPRQEQPPPLGAAGAPTRRNGRGTLSRLFRWWPFGPVAEVTPAELQAHLLREGTWQLIDVRTPGEWARGHIVGARSLPIHQLSGSLAAIQLDRGHPVIAICKTAHRSVPAVRLLRAAGYDARQLAGGMDHWRRAGFPERSVHSEEVS
jgi:rhodanese-related sulfurtransferase